jgi:hypothetical protein
MKESSTERLYEEDEKRRMLIIATKHTKNGLSQRLEALGSTLSAPQTILYLPLSVLKYS